MALRIEPPTGPCYYQTPAMRGSDHFLPGELVASGPALAIRKPNGKYLTVFYDGTDRESDEVYDQEQFIPERSGAGDKLVLTADRMRYQDQMAEQGGAKCYAISVVLA